MFLKERVLLVQRGLQVAPAQSGDRDCMREQATTYDQPMGVLRVRTSSLHASARGDKKDAFAGSRP